MVAVDGEAARALADIARERWQLATGAEARSPCAARPRSLARRPCEPDLRGVEVGIARTMPPRGEHAGGARGRAAVPRHDRRGAQLHLHREPVLHLAARSPRRWRSASPSPTAPRSCWCCACSATAGSKSTRCTCCARACIAAPEESRPPRPLPRLLPAHPGARRGLLPRRALQGDDRRRPRAARRLGQHLQPLDGRWTPSATC